jgi:alanyl-tRNA synthetase
LIEDAKRSQTSWIDADDAFRLHDTYGFPYDLTKELLADEGLAVDDEGFEALMEQQRARARGGLERRVDDRHQQVISFVNAAPPTNFVGYESLEAQTSVAAAQPLDDDSRLLVKLEDSPFYAEGGGQVADSGVIATNGHQARVEDVYRVGDDQAIRVTDGELRVASGDRVEARVDHEARHATMRNHTATHLLHAGLRDRLGTHVRQAGSAVRPDKLRFDFTHGAPLAPDELREIEDRVNDWIKASRPVRAMQMSRAEAEALGAMALFGEKYGDWVRVIEVDAVSRELCGGTHVANTAEIGIFAIVSEGSSAANVRRIEALTGPAAIDYFREQRDLLTEAGRLLGSARDPVGAAGRAAERLSELEDSVAELGRREAGEAAERLGEQAEDVFGIRVIVAEVDGLDQRRMLELADRIKSRAGDAAVVLGSSDPDQGKVALVATFDRSAVDRGLSAAEVIRAAAAVVGGGGGGRDEVAQAGGRQPERLAEALETARTAIRNALDE